MEIKNKNFAIIGFGKSGQDAAKLIHKYGGNIFVSNNNNLDENQKQLIKSLHCNYEINHSEKILNNDFIILSPGVDINNPILQKAIEKNIPIIPEIELAFNILNTKIIGITGTNGKSTTTYLIYQLLNFLGMDCEYGGNISPGKSLSEIAFENENTNKIIVCELSSFQLEHINTFAPYIGIITNITEDHIDRHKSFENYKNSKLNIFKNMNNNDYAIINFDDINLKNIKTNATTLFTSLKDKTKGAYYYNQKNNIIINMDKKISINIDNFNLPGEHNIFNLAVSLLATYLIKPFENIDHLIEKLKGMVHRMEYIGEINSIKIYNNSMCTNPIAFYNSLKAINNKQTVIVGGRNKDFDINIILDSIIKFANNTVLIGESKDMLYKLLKEKNYNNIYKANTLEEAINIAIKISEKNSVINFSPGFASFDMFKNFIDRGNQFKALIGAIINEN